MLTTPQIFALDVLAGVLFVYFLRLVFLRWRRFPLPPGPKGIPIFGNAFQFPTVYPECTYEKWGRELGKVFETRSNISFLNTL